MDLFDLSAVLRLDTKEYEKAIDDARKKGEWWAKESNKNIGGALNKAQQGFTVFKGVLSNVISSGINAFASAITNNLEGAISRVDTLNNYGVVMQNLGHGAEESEKAIDALVEGIDGLPTTLDGIASIQQQFVALGGSMEDATELTLALNNATLAGGQGQEKANAAMSQWYQMIAAGKPDLMSMRIINEAMPAQLDAIAKSVIGADANWQQLNTEWQKNPEITQKVKDAIVQLNEEGLNGTAGFAQQAKDATQGIQTSMQNMQTAVKNGIANVIQEIGTDKIAGVFASLKDAVKNAFGGIVEFIQNVKEFGFAEAVQKEVDNFTKVLDNLPGIVEDVMGKARDAFNNFAQNFDYAGMVDQVIQSLSTSLPKIIESLASFFSDTLAPWLAENGADIIVSLAKGVINALPTIISAMGQIANGILKVVVGIPALLLAKGLMAVGKFALGILKGVNKVATAGGKLVSAVVKGIKKLPSQFLSWAGKGISSFVKGISNGAKKAVDAAKKLAKGAVEKLKDGFGKVKDIGTNIVKGIGQGITNGKKWIEDRIREFVGNVKSFLKNLFGIKSPSKWARDNIGKMIDAGLALGIENNADMVDDAMKDVVPNIDGKNNTATVPSTGKNLKMVYPVFNTDLTVNGADDPEKWGVSFANALEMKVRAI